MVFRRAAALGAVLVATGAMAGELPGAWGDARAVMGPDGEAVARRVYERFVCLADVVAALPPVATYVEPHEDLPEVEWYQRAVEMSSGELPIVGDLDQAEQVLELVLVAPGTGRCDDVDVRVRST